jgi:hypothetical protein
MFYRELAFWQIPTPEQYMRPGTDNQLYAYNYRFNEFDPDWVAQTLVIEGPSNTVVHKRNQEDQHGIVYCKYPMNA